MLQTKKFENNQVMCFKLVSGEEIIARIKSEEANSYKLSSARTLVMTQTGAGMVPVATLGTPDTDIELLHHSVMFTYPPQKTIENKYIQEVSNIKVADSTQQNKIIS